MMPNKENIRIFLKPDEGINEAFANIVVKLRENWRIKHPTKFEKILDMFINSSDKGVTMDEIIQLYEYNKEDSESQATAVNAATTAIVRLNKKLKMEGYQIKRSDTYFVFPTETP